MGSKISETLKALLGTLGFLFVLLPIFLIGIPFTILSAPNHSNLFNIGVFRYFGMVPIGIGVIIYFLVFLSLCGFWQGYTYPYHAAEGTGGKGIVQVCPKPHVPGRLFCFSRRNLAVSV